MRGPSPALIFGAFAALSLIWGTTWAAIRIGLQGIPPFTGVALRFAIACVALLALARALRVRLGTSRREKALWIVTTLLSFCVAYGVVYWGEQWVPSGLGAVLFATYPLFVALISHFFLPDERLTVPAVAGVLLGFGGVAVIFSTDFSLFGGRQVAVASAVMLLSPVSAAVSSVAVKRYGAGVHPISLTVVPMGLTALVMGALALLVERGRTVTFDAVSVSALLYLALLGSAVTFTVYYWLLSHLSATRVSLVAYAIPVVAVFVGAVFLAEPITTRTLAGSALVVVGVALTVQSHSWKRQVKRRSALARP